MTVLAGVTVPPAVGKLLRFAIVSACGLALDFCVFAGLIHVGLWAVLANAIGATCAVCWVYFASVRRIFRYSGRSLRAGFTAYAAYQIVGITAASWFVGVLIERAGLHPLVSKCLVLPCTFTANFLFMSWLTRAQKAHRVPAGTPGARPRILVFVPMYLCERQICRVLARIEQHLAGRIDAVLVVDNGSKDRSCAVASEALARMSMSGTVLQNHVNVNLGGSHKVAFCHARDHGYDWVIVVHGDDQAEPADIAPLIDEGRLNEATDALLGSRFSHGARRIGYAMHRTWGNYCFNLLFTCACGRQVADLGSGLNAFRVAWLSEHAWFNLADDLTFNIHLLLRLVHDRANFNYFPITWREEDQVSNVRLFRQAWRTLGIAWGYFLLRGAYLARSHARLPPTGYTARTISVHNAPVPGSVTTGAGSL